MPEKPSKKPVRRVKVVKRKPAPLHELVSRVNKDLGDGMLQTFEKGSTIEIKRVTSTRFETLDAALGRGGVPSSRLTILHGREGSGKTTVALTSAGEAIRQDALVVYMDTEHKLDPEWMQKCGVDLSSVVISQPPHLELCFEIIDRALTGAKELGRWAFVVLDSMNAAITKAQFDGDWDTKVPYGPQAAYMSTHLPKMMGKVVKAEATLVFISQVRADVKTGKDKLACGNAPKFHCSVIVSCRHAALQKVGENVVGVDLKARVVKNQVAPPFREALIKIMPDGPDFDWSLIDQAVVSGIVSKGGAGWYEWSRGSGTLKFQGPNGWKKLLGESPALADELRFLLRARYG